MGEWYTRSQKDPTKLSVYGSMCVSADWRYAGVGLFLCMYESAAAVLFSGYFMLRNRIRDPVPFWPLDPGSELGKKSGSGMNNPDHIFESLETIFGG